MYQLIDSQKQGPESKELAFRLIQAGSLSNIKYPRLRKIFTFLFGTFLLLIFFSPSSQASIWNNNWFTYAYHFWSQKINDLANSVQQFVVQKITGAVNGWISAAGSDFVEMLQQVAQATHNFLAAALAVASQFSDTSKELLTILFVFLVVWNSILIVVSDDTLSAYFKKLIELGINYTLILFILIHYQWMFNHLLDTFNYVANVLDTGAGGPNLGTSAEAQQISGIIGVFTELFAIIIGAISAITAGFSLNFVADLVRFFAAFIVALLGFSLLFVAARYISQFFLSVVLVAIGAALGPVMIPFLMWDKSRFLFDGWFKFVIGAGLYRVVGALAFVLISIALAALMPNSNLQIYSKGLLSIPVVIMIFLIIRILGFVIDSLPAVAAEIATGFPKSINANDINFSPRFTKSG